VFRSKVVKPFNRVERKRIHRYEVTLIFFLKYIWLQMADEGDSSSSKEKSKSSEELGLQSSNNDVRSGGLFR